MASPWRAELVEHREVADVERPQLQPVHERALNKGFPASATAADSRRMLDPATVDLQRSDRRTYADASRSTLFSKIANSAAWGP